MSDITRGCTPFSTPKWIHWTEICLDLWRSLPGAGAAMSCHISNSSIHGKESKQQTKGCAKSPNSASFISIICIYIYLLCIYIYIIYMISFTPDYTNPFLLITHCLGQDWNHGKSTEPLRPSRLSVFSPMVRNSESQKMMTTTSSWSFRLWRQ